MAVSGFCGLYSLLRKKNVNNNSVPDPGKLHQQFADMPRFTGLTGECRAGDEYRVTRPQVETMHINTGIITISCWRCLLAAILICLVPQGASAAGPGGAMTGTQAGDSKTVEDAILEELKAIRQVLEKIEKKGLAGGQQRPARPTTATVAIANKPVMGSESAPVTVVEFTDYQCPYCLRFTKTTFPYLKRDYIDTGKVRWVALNLPLPFHKDARKARGVVQESTKNGGGEPPRACRQRGCGRRGIQGLHGK
jgi:hypothetical protein